jgi:tetratricopeptide (TPR) repeat protein
MAYVRQHGNQIAIVSGDRDKQTGNVQQRVLFTFYSKDEARAALGHDADDRKHLFQNLMRQAYPSSSFDWPKINDAIAQKLDTLPEKYEGRSTECGANLSHSINTLARNLILADPYMLPSAKKVLKSQETSLLALRELIDHSLSLIRLYDKHGKDDEEDEFCKDEFYWRYMLRGSEVPPDLEEWAEGFYRKMEYPLAEAIFELLVSAFDNYAEGYNYLGLIALERRQYKKAIGHFEKTVAVGRNLFPRKLPKKDYWSNHSTRPFMRGMMNLILALTSDGDYQKALTVCDQFEKECGDKTSANAYRATLHLNLGNWDEAIAYTTSDQDFVKAFALSESGNQKKALECFLLDAVESPHTARMLLHMKKPKPENSSAVDDHNSGVHLVAQLDGFFRNQSIQSRKFFDTLAKQPALVEMFEKLDRHTHNHSCGPREKHSENFKEWHAMREKPYVREQAKKLMATINKNSLKLVK